MHSEAVAPMLPGMIPYSPALALVAPLRVTQSFFSSNQLNRAWGVDHPAHS